MAPSTTDAARRRGGLRTALEGRGAGHRAIGLEDQREGAVAALVEAVLEQVEAPLGVGPRDAEAVAEQLADVGGAIATQDEQDQPGGDDLLSMTYDPAGPSLQGRLPPEGA